MTYAEMLSDIIKKSELSLRQIAKRCEDLNLKIAPSYISQLKNGKLPPAERRSFPYSRKSLRFRSASPFSLSGIYGKSAGHGKRIYAGIF